MTFIPVKGFFRGGVGSAVSILGVCLHLIFPFVEYFGACSGVRYAVVVKIDGWWVALIEYR